MTLNSYSRVVKNSHLAVRVYAIECENKRQAQPNQLTGKYRSSCAIALWLFLSTGDSCEIHNLWCMLKYTRYAPKSCAITAGSLKLTIFSASRILNVWEACYE